MLPCLLLLPARSCLPACPLLPACPQIALDVARGLVFLHSKRVAHFDLKSPNILLAKYVHECGAEAGWGRVGQAVFSAYRQRLLWAPQEGFSRQYPS